MDGQLSPSPENDAEKRARRFGLASQRGKYTRFENVAGSENIGGVRWEGRSFGARINLTQAQAMVGRCMDMCPEKER
eukprot:CAMPEP_0184662562 /NCGR_PEP_ID=MMETSP0308-20130426/43828_1 /TAXON_ID=38269 /ORGANISM="Gloeochaete witrockiana, Strain SAG 46.84" /LENGTH=76 /DNA_ID=CAMNT_0027104677 /DNA_START=43 /DNA_END=269 /DNA_ORIENTATION=+